jgi:predicted GNAT family acetyltransferase
MTIDIRHNEPASRYELWVDEELASVADYRIVDDRIVFHHTETAVRFRDQGLAARLVGHALDDVRGTRRNVVPACSFVAQFIDDHAVYHDLVAPGVR